MNVPKIVRVSYVIAAHNDVFVCHHFDNGYVMRTFLKRFPSEEAAFDFVRSEFEVTDHE